MRVLAEKLVLVAPFCWRFNSYGIVVAKNGCKVAEESVGELVMHKSREKRICDYFEYNVLSHCIRHIPCFEFVGIDWFRCGT